MLLKIILVLLVILLGLIIVLPFVLNLIGFNVLDLGSVGGGGIIRTEDAALMRSSDGGESWENFSVSENKRISFPAIILDFAFHPTNPNLLFIGSYRSGLWRSDNGGTLWKKVDGGLGTPKGDSDVYAIEASHKNPNIIYLAVFQDRRGRVLKSEDEGASFQEVYFVATDGYEVLDLSIDHGDPNHVFIATGQGGILETKNGGRTWSVVRWFAQPVRSLLTSPVNFQEMYALVGESQLFKSVDGGENWADLGPGIQKTTESIPQQAPQGIFNPFQGLKSHSIEALTLDPKDTSTMYLGSGQGLLRSLDGGFIWHRLDLLIPPEALPVSAVSLHPLSSQAIFAGAASNIHRSQDAGASWNIKTLPVSGRIKGIFVHPLNPQTMFAVLVK